jgi:hypothetical protein
MKLTAEQRRKAYEFAIDKVMASPEFNPYMCDALKWYCISTFYNYLFDRSQIPATFPEFKLFIPNRKDIHERWLDKTPNDNNVLVTILLFCIEMTKK